MTQRPIPDEGTVPARRGERAPGPHRKPSRRRFTDAYKLRILEEIDACTEPGQISKLLRREKLYSSYLVEWRQARARGALGPRPDPPGGHAEPAAPGLDRLSAIEQENRQLQERLTQAGLILDIQETTLKLFSGAPESRAPADDTRRSPRGA